MDKNRVLDRIIEVAKELARDEKTCTRADLAYELKSLGVGGDTAELCGLVLEAYQKSHNPHVAERILENDGRHSVVDGQQIVVYSADRDARSLQSVSQKHLDSAGRGLSSVNQMLEDVVTLSNVRQNTTLQSITGASGIESVRKDANDLYVNYQKAVEGYANAKSDVLTSVADFVAMRNEVADVFRRYAMELVDIFGDRITAVAPQLFDFASVEFLDVAQMQKGIELEFNKITDTCGVLLSEVVDSFKSSFAKASSDFRIAGGGAEGVLLAGAQFVSHYLQAGEKTARVRKEYEDLRAHAGRDAGIIHADVGRLAVIHKTLNELLTPRAVAFLGAADKVMSAELRSLVDSAYVSAEAKRLRSERDEILALCKKLESSVEDHQTNVGFYAGVLSDSEQVISALGDEYEDAKRRKPAKPLLFGKENYRRELTEWSEYAEPVITRYENVLVDKKLATDDMAAHNAQLTKDSADLATARARLAEVNAKLRSAVAADDDVRRAIAPHLQDFVALLSLAKEIVESKLDERHIGAITIEPFREMGLADATRKGLNELCDSLGADISAEIKSGVGDGSSGVVAQASGVVKALIDLGAAFQQGRETRDHFERQSQALRVEFTKQLNDVADKAAVLRQVIAKVNTGENHTDVKNALLLLSEADGLRLSAKDIDEFLSGNQNIRI